jgi:hypothetical protein
VLLRALGVTDAVFIPGGLADWWDEVMAPTIPRDAPPAERAAMTELSHYFGGSPQIGEGAASAPEAPRRFRRRGC